VFSKITDGHVVVLAFVEGFVEDSALKNTGIREGQCLFAFLMP